MNGNTTIQNTPTRKTIVTGKHKEILIEMLLYYVTSHDFLIENKYMVDDIKAQNETGKEWIEYYINTAY